MSSIAFSFDADALGVLAAVDAIIGAFGQLIGATDALTSSFASVASQSATMNAGLGALIQNFGALAGTMNDGSAAMGSAGNSAANLAYQLQQMAERAADAATAHAEAVAAIAQQEADLTQSTQEQIANRTQTYDDSLHNMVEQHQYTMQQIGDQENTLSDTYQQAIDKRLQALNDPRAMQHKYIVDALQQQIDASLATGNTAGIAGLENQLNHENTSYATYINNTIMPYYKFLDLKGYESHQTALQRLHDRLTQENTLYAQHLSDLKKHFDQELSVLELHYKQEEQRLDDHLAKENQKYAQQVERIAEEQAHLLSGGGAGGGAIQGSPPVDQFIALFKKLGIDPSTNAGVIQGKAALQAWLTGGSYKGTDFGSGYAQNSQLSIQDLWGFITQGMAYGQDPTKNLGGGNLLDVISNLAANSQLINGKGQAASINSIRYIFEKLDEGNMNQMLRQLGTLGIYRSELENFGIKFGGRGGQEILNPADMLGAVERIGLSPGFAGQGYRQSMDTPSGAMTRQQDTFSGIVASIMGDTEDPNSLMHRVMNAWNGLLAFFRSHRQEIVNFGKTIVEWLTGKFQDFVNFLNSSQAKSILVEVGNGFKKIGDALHWIGQHKEVFEMLGKLLAFQMVGKFLGGISIAPLLGLLSGGPIMAILAFIGGIGTTIASILALPILGFLISLARLFTLLAPVVGPIAAGFIAFGAGLAAIAVVGFIAIGLLAGLVAFFVINRQKIMPFIHTIQDFFGHQLKDAQKSVQDFAKEVQSRLDPAFGPNSGVHKALMFFERFWQGAWSGIKLTFSGIWDMITGIITIAWNIVKGIILIGLDLLGGKWGQAWDDIKKMFGGVWDGIVLLLKGAFKTVMGVLTGFFGGLWAQISGKAQDFSKSIIKWLQDLGKGFTDFFGKTLPDAIGNAFNGMGKMVRVSIDWIVDHVIPGPLRGPIHSAMGFADGGMYPGGNVAVIGERGPELFFSNHSGAVVSNENIRQALMGAGGNMSGQTINFNNAQFILPGVRNAAQFYKEMNKLAGKYAEHGVRGALN